MVADSTSGYVCPYDAEDDAFELLPWARDLAMRSHLGGTSFPVQTLQPGFTPWYLELEELPGMNLGSGSAQIDLESESFDWAC